MTLRWLDLYCGADPHPGRFDRPETALAYLRRVERLSEPALEIIATRGEVEPPLARRAYKLTGVPCPAPDPAESRA